MIDFLRRLRTGLNFQWLIIVGRMPSHTVRKFFYRRAGMVIGRRSYIYSGAEVRSPERIVIGDDVIVGHRAILDGRCGINIEDNVNFSTGVWIWTMQHDHQSETFDAVGAPVNIGESCWISARTIVLPGVRIGARSVVAAGSVVTKDLPENGVFGGVPAKQIGKREIEIKYRLGSFGATPII